jgi:hypothetical protein
MSKQPSKRRGRPTTPATPGERGTVSLRMTAELKGRIDEEAKSKGRAFSHEAELRLEQSFQKDGSFLSQALELAYGPAIAGVVQVMAAAMSDASRSAVFMEAGNLDNIEQWPSSPYAYDQVMKAAVTVLDQFRPDGEVKQPKRFPIVFDAMVGVGAANRRLGALTGDVGSPELSRWVGPIKDQLRAHRTPRMISITRTTDLPSKGQR